MPDHWHKAKTSLNRAAAASRGQSGSRAGEMLATSLEFRSIRYRISCLSDREDVGHCLDDWNCDPGSELAAPLDHESQASEGSG